MRILSFILFLIPLFSMAQNTITVSHPSQLNTISSTDYSPGCIYTINIPLPAGENVYITGIDIGYDFQSIAPNFPAVQKSKIYFENGQIEEPTYGSSNTTAGAVENYARSNVDIANGTYAGELPLPLT